MKGYPSAFLTDYVKGLQLKPLNYVNPYESLWRITNKQD